MEAADEPLPGPRPYRAEDRARFHGRGDQAKKLARRVLAHPCVTLFGPSGAGKSSLMAAAVIPMLAEERAFRAVRVDGWPPAEAPVPWLVRAIFAALDLGEAPGDLDDSGRVIEALDQALGLAEQRSDRPILIYLDQLEQILFPGRSADEARALVEAVDRMANKRIRGLQVVVSLREDYLGRLRDRARGRRELLDHGFRLGPLTVAEMTRAVCEAAAEAGQVWDEAQVRKLMLHVRAPGQLEGDEAEVEAAFGQIVCRALWERRAGGEGRAAGAEDAEEIVRRYLDETLQELGPRKEAAQRFLEERLVDPEGNRTLLTEQEARGALPAEAAAGVLEHLERAAVLKAEAHHGSRYFELGHDWLAKRVFERRKERKEKEEQARARKAQRTLIGIAAGAVAVAVLMGALLVWALKMRRVAEEQRRAAESAEAQAVAQQRAAEAAEARALTQRIAARDAAVMSGIRELMARGDTLWARMLPVEVERPAEQRGWFELTLELLSRSPFTATLAHAADVRSAHFSPDGKRVVTASADNTARVWELDGSGKFIDLNGHVASVRSAAFSADGKRVVTASADNTARVWELDDSGKFIELKGHASRVTSAAFSPDGKRIVTASWDKTARLWPATIQDLQEFLRASTPGCIPVYMRQTYLVETDTEAREADASCERSRSPAAAAPKP
ncbi:nSTAND1 domain-containing NTPase [Sorangium sp. So ce1151]|uniref:nSTAND1 domain-containing NTPase n=1 Tax=Sorangium sp. So ce1151 TaxID=3133332 RepID=UPI003F5DCD0D